MDHNIQKICQFINIDQQGMTSKKGQSEELRL